MPPIIYVKSCPVCDQGLCRIRVCVEHQGILGFVLCDECEAMWANPEMSERIERMGSDCEPVCPNSDLSVWDSQCHWASIGEVCLLGWFDRVLIAK